MTPNEQAGVGRPATERSFSDADRRRIAEDGCIIRGLVGSTIHGLMLEGQDDRDEMAVAIEPPEAAVGLVGFEHWVYRTKPEGVRSGPGDLDLTTYSLRKYARLAAAGNPTTLLLLFIPRDTSSPRHRSVSSCRHWRRRSPAAAAWSSSWAT